MMKTINKILLIITSIYLLCGCSADDSMLEAKNYLGGCGEFNQEYGRNSGLAAFYDDEYIYIPDGFELKAFNRVDGAYRPICIDASCKHDVTTCKQNTRWDVRAYFVFNNKLYYSIAGKYIYDATTESVVHTITVPKELTEASDSDKYKDSLFIATPINEEYLQFNCLQYAYIVDKDFNVTYWHKRGESWRFAMIDGDTYYYTSDFRIIKVDLKTGEETILATEGSVIDIDTNSKGFFYTNTFNELFKYDLATQESTYIADNVALICCSEEHIYYKETNLNALDSVPSKEIRAIDEQGKLVYTIPTPIAGIGTSDIYIIGDKLYEYDTQGIMLISTLDGSKYSSSNGTIIEETTSSDDNIKRMRLSSSPLYSYIERNGVVKKGPAVETISYSNEPIRLTYDYIYELKPGGAASVPEVFFVMINDELCISELSTGEKGYMHYMTSTINENKELDFYVYPHKLYSDKINVIRIYTFPLGNYSRQESLESYSVITFDRDIVSSVELTETVDLSSASVIFDDFVNIYGKTLEEKISASEYSYFNTSEYIFETDNGYMYTHIPSKKYSDGKEKRYHTFLFCDGKLYNGFDGKYMTSWVSDGNDTVHHQIDISSLDKGKHELFVINIDTTRNFAELYSDVYTIEVE